MSRSEKIGKNASIIVAGAEQLIKHLSKNKVPIAVASSSAQKPFEVKIKAHKPLFDLFHHIVLGSSDPEVKQGKPAPDIFKVCAQRFSDQPEYHKVSVFLSL